MFFDGVGADADDRDAFGGELGVGITEGAALLRAAAGERFGIKPDERVGVFGVDVGEVEGDTGIGGGGRDRSGVADLEGSGGSGGGKHGEEGG